VPVLIIFQTNQGLETLVAAIHRFRASIRTLSGPLLGPVQVSRQADSSAVTECAAAACRVNILSHTRHYHIPWQSTMNAFPVWSNRTLEAAVFVVTMILVRLSSTKMARTLSLRNTTSSVLVRFPRSIRLHACLKRKRQARHRFPQESEQRANLIWLTQHRHGCPHACFTRMNRHPLLGIDSPDLPN
jgi:hypothetical protein